MLSIRRTILRGLPLILAACSSVAVAGPIVTLHIDNPIAVIERPDTGYVTHLFTGTVTNNSEFVLGFDGDMNWQGGLGFDSLHQEPFGPQMLMIHPIYGEFSAGLQSLDSEIFLKLSSCVDSTGDPFGCLNPGESISGVLTSVYVGSTTAPGVYAYDFQGGTPGIELTGSYLLDGQFVHFREESNGVTITVTAVPEPASALMLAAGMLLLGATTIKRRRKL